MTIARIVQRLRVALPGWRVESYQDGPWWDLGGGYRPARTLVRITSPTGAVGVLDPTHRKHGIRYGFGMSWVEIDLRGRGWVEQYAAGLGTTNVAPPRVRTPRGDLLDAVRRHGPMSLREAARVTGWSRSTLAPVYRALVAEGLTEPHVPAVRSPEHEVAAWMATAPTATIMDRLGTSDATARRYRQRAAQQFPPSTQENQA